MIYPIDTNVYDGYKEINKGDMEDVEAIFFTDKGLLQFLTSPSPPLVTIKDKNLTDVLTEQSVSYYTTSQGSQLKVRYSFNTDSELYPQGDGFVFEFSAYVQDDFGGITYKTVKIQVGVV